jgi:hypothetical protein
VAEERKQGLGRRGGTSTVAMSSIFEMPSSMFDAQQGIFDVQQGIVNVQQGIVNVQWGIVNVQQGIVDVQWGTEGVQSGRMEAHCFPLRSLYPFANNDFAPSIAFSSST